MRHADASNSNFSTEARFELLSEIYLDPFIERFSPHWIGIFESTQPYAELRSFRGSQPLHSSPTIHSSTTIESKDPATFFAKESKLQLIQPIRFKELHLGWIVMEVETNSISKEAAKSLKDISDQISSIFAWKTRPWGARLQALEALWTLQKMHRDFDWIGIYRRDSIGEDRLTLSTYIGEPTEHIEIPISSGICGAAVREEKTLNIPNVHEDPRFIACSTKTQSELVVPIRNLSNEVVAEIDIDSNTPRNFSREKMAHVEAVAEDLGRLPELFNP